MNKINPMNKKGAIELSINTLVTIIISIVILAAGITLIYNFIGGAENIKTQLDSQTNAELEHLLVDQGKQVALPLHTITLERGSTHVFGIGILNVGGQLNGTDIGTEFSIQANFVKLVLPNNEVDTEVTLEEINTWLLYSKDPITIKENDNVKESILVNVPTNAKTGQYIFNANVILKDTRQYGNTQKFYVTVK